MDTEGQRNYLENLREELNNQFPTKIPGEFLVAEQVAKDMVDNEHIFELSNDEVRMLKAYRNLKQRKANGLFRWSYSTEDTIVTPETPSLIVDPNDESRQ